MADRVPDPVEVLTRTPEETEALGQALGVAARGGELLGLVGDLGAGKTCFVRGLARGLGADPEAVHSPTFVLATEYPGGRLPLHHLDLYRLEPPVTDTTFLRDAFGGDGVAAVEWFERLPTEAYAEALVVTLRYGAGETRRVHLAASGTRHARWLAAALT